MNILFRDSESTSYDIAKNREIAQLKINKFIFLSSFRKEIRNWVPQNCLWVALGRFESNI